MITVIKIVQNFDWSRSAEKDIMQGKIGYQDLYAKLSTSLFIWERVRRGGEDPNLLSNLRILKNTGFNGYRSKYAHVRNGSHGVYPKKAISYLSQSSHFSHRSGNGINISSKQAVHKNIFSASNANNAAIFARIAMCTTLPA